MKSKIKKWMLWGCGLVVSFAVLFIVFICGMFFYLTRDNRIAANPEEIANEADFDLPAYVVVSQNDNMDRGASAWSSYRWELELKEPLSEKSLKELDKLVQKNSHWKYYQEGKAYIYELEENERNFSIRINVDKRRVYMYYEWWDVLS